MAEGFHNEPNLDKTAEKHAHRIMNAINEEYKNDKQIPRVVIVVESPPVGEIGLASTGDDDRDVLRMSLLGVGAIKSAIRADGQDPDVVEQELLEEGKKLLINLKNREEFDLKRPTPDSKKLF